MRFRQGLHLGPCSVAFYSAPQNSQDGFEDSRMGMKIGMERVKGREGKRGTRNLRSEKKMKNKSQQLRMKFELLAAVVDNCQRGAILLDHRVGTFIGRRRNAHRYVTFNDLFGLPIWKQ